MLGGQRPDQNNIAVAALGSQNCTAGASWQADVSVLVRNCCLECCWLLCGGLLAASLPTGSAHPLAVPSTWTLSAPDQEGDATPQEEEDGLPQLVPHVRLSDPGVKLRALQHEAQRKLSSWRQVVHRFAGCSLVWP